MKTINAKDNILEAADKLFGEMGYDATTTREIAKLSGVNKALIHYHFKSKEGLYVSVLDRYYGTLDAMLKKALRADGGFREKMTSLIDAYVDFLAKNLNFSRMVQRESSGGPYFDRIRDHLMPMFQTATAMLHAQFPSTREGEMSAHHLLVSFYGMIVTYFTYSGAIEGLSGRDPLSAGELDMRKKHLYRMLELIEQAIREE